MTQNQIAWAAKHNWFLSTTDNGIMVEEVAIDAVTLSPSVTVIEFNCFSALREWAGY